MKTNRKADPFKIGSKTNYFDGHQKAFSILDYRTNQPFQQCKKCRSDYMKFAIDGFCLDCIQRAEFVIREHPEVVATVKNSWRDK